MTSSVNISHPTSLWECASPLRTVNTVFNNISDYREDVVFILWGKPAQQKIKLIDTAKHHIIKSISHPTSLWECASPLRTVNTVFNNRTPSRAQSCRCGEVLWILAVIELLHIYRTGRVKVFCY
jgi:uracil DNA glycosylase